MNSFVVSLFSDRLQLTEDNLGREILLLHQACVYCNQSAYHIFVNCPALNMTRDFYGQCLLVKGRSGSIHSW